jgi:hypothetical protein
LALPLILKPPLAVDIFIVVDADAFDLFDLEQRARLAIVLFFVVG